ARRADAALRVPGLRGFAGPDAGLPGEPGGAPGRFPRRAAGAARSDRRGVAAHARHARASRSRGRHVLDCGPAPLGARSPRTTLDIRRPDMSDIAALSALATRDATRSPGSIAARTAVLAVGLFVAMLAGEALAAVLVPSVGAA